MNIENTNSIVIEDDEGIIIITDIFETNDMLVGEFVYDGKNVGVYNRNNDKYYTIQNIPPSIRDRLVNSEEVTIIEKSTDDISAYSVKVRIVEDMGISDKWDVYSKNLISDLQDVLTKEEYEQIVTK